MSTLVPSHLDDHDRDALQVLSLEHGHAIEAEARDILACEATSGRRIDWEAIATVDTGHTGPVTREQIQSTYDDIPVH